MVETSRATEKDARDIAYALSRYWNEVDINRIPEQEMNDFVGLHTSAAPAWSQLKRKYGMCVSSNSVRNFEADPLSFVVFTARS